MVRTRAMAAGDATDAAAPTHWRRLLVVFAVRSASDRAWAYVVPLVLARDAQARPGATLSGSALLFLVRTAVEVAALPAAAACWDGTSRRAGAFLAAEHTCLVASAVGLRALAEPSGGTGGGARSFGAPLPLLAACGVATGVEAALSKTLWNAVEKQQTFDESLRGGAEDASSAHFRLAATNAALSRIDLAVGALAPFGVGALASWLGVVRALVALVCLQLVAAVAAAPWLLHAVDATYKAAQGEEARSAEGGDACKGSGEVGLVVYAHALLHFTVVSPSGILLVWLRERKLPETSITTFVAAAQLCGAVGSWLPALALRRSNGRVGGAAAKVQAVHAAAVVSAAAAVCGDSVYGLLLATTLSRAALWGVDLLGRQVVQTSAGDECRRMKAFAQQGSLSQVAACAMYLLALSGASFPAQCCASSAAVLLAAMLLAIHARRAEITSGPAENFKHKAE